MPTSSWWTRCGPTSSFATWTQQWLGSANRTERWEAESDGASIPASQQPTPCRKRRQFVASIEVLTCFVSAQGETYGRPVCVSIDCKDAFLVADDVGNVGWRVSRTTHRVRQAHSAPKL